MICFQLWSDSVKVRQVFVKILSDFAVRVFGAGFWCVWGAGPTLPVFPNTMHS